MCLELEAWLSYSTMLVYSRLSRLGGWVRGASTKSQRITFFKPSLIRRGNNGVSWYPRYQQIFWLTENFDQNYRYFVAKMTLMQKLLLFLSCIWIIWTITTILFWLTENCGCPFLEVTGNFL